MASARLLTCGALVCLLASSFYPSHAQFRSTTSLVEVDVIVLDGKGRFVPGLRSDDLALFEDGKPQKIEQFYMVTHDPGGSVISEHAADADHLAQRVFVILFDEGHLANDSLMRVKAGAERFVREQIGPRDIGGVFVDGAMHGGRLTTDKHHLVAAIRAVSPTFDNRQELLAPFREFPQVPGETDAIRIADGARELAAALAAEACRADEQQCAIAGGVERVEDLIERKSRDYVSQARTLTGQTLQNLRTVARGLSRIPGRKTVILLSEGFFVAESRGILQRLAAEAARAGTVIYSIDGRGLINPLRASPDVGSRERPRTTAFDTGEDGPNILTAGTGGFMVRGIDDMARAFGMVVRDTSTYYVLGYQPDNGVLDGKFRKIEVRSRIAGHKVRARKGYAAVPLPPPQTLSGGR